MNSKTPIDQSKETLSPTPASQERKKRLPKDYAAAISEHSSLTKEISLHPAAYFRELGTDPSIVGESLVRHFAVYDDEHFSIEQDISNTISCIRRRGSPRWPRATAQNNHGRKLSTASSIKTADKPSLSRVLPVPASIRSIDERTPQLGAASKDDPAQQVAQADAAAASLLEDYQALLHRANSLSQLYNEGIDEIRTTFFFLPLSSTISLFGMNFKELGVHLSIWIWVVVTVPVFGVSVILCFWRPQPVNLDLIFCATTGAPTPICTPPQTLHHKKTICHRATGEALSLTYQMAGAIIDTGLEKYVPLLARGKVREVYALDDVDGNSLLFVATDRISAYDVIMRNGIPQKGALLTSLSAHWFSYLSTQIPTLRTHFLSISLPASLTSKIPDALKMQLEGRSMQVRRLKVFPIEAIVRGYITGSAWKEYCEKGTVHGMQIEEPEGGKFLESERLTAPIYTPSTKAEVGGKDENIHPDEAARIVGPKYASQIVSLSLQIYGAAHEYALTRGIIIADTKFEFGLDEATDEVVLIDEVLTPDSSRFWPKEKYEPGRGQESFDKQFLRDWLTTEGLKGKSNVVMPDNIVLKTREKYQQAFKLLF
ncbi:hypothetical protein B7494_g5054 [Chlorociboria aeruginascens]|nr:hypothetical protein B7494_g5054 [Chlorociboria aeruginascens]